MSEPDFRFRASSSEVRTSRSRRLARVGAVRHRSPGSDDRARGSSGIELLDVGCGTKLVKILLDDSLPIGHYTGIDVAPA